MILTLVLTETWCKDNSNDEFFLQQCCPNGYYYLSANRKRNGRGLAVFYDGTLSVDNFSNNCSTNVEVAFIELISVNIFLCIYRRTNTSVRAFISELTSFFEAKALLFKKLFCR